MSGTKAEEGTPTLPLPLQFLAAWLAVWLSRVLQRQIDYLKEENRALKEQLGDRKLRLTDATRRRLAVLGKELGRKVLAEVATIATPETILRWLCAAKTPCGPASGWDLVLLASQGR